MSATILIFPLPTAKLESLIDQYEEAIFAGGSIADIARLSDEVEAEADRINYKGHARLMALHTAAERASIAIEEARA